MITKPFKRKPSRQSAGAPVLISAPGPLTARTMYANPLVNSEPSYTITMTAVRPSGASWLGGTDPVLWEVGNVWFGANTTNCYVSAVDGKITIATIDGASAQWSGTSVTGLASGAHTFVFNLQGNVMTVTVDGAAHPLSMGGTGTGLITTQGTELWLAGGGSNVAGNITVTDASVARP